LSDLHSAPVAEEAGQVRRDRDRDPEAEARRQLALSQIRQYGDPVLRMQAREVEAFDDDLVRLAGRMKHLMSEASGVGLAGNQVGVLRRVVVIQPSAEEESFALVNPRIVERSDATEVADEGCLSMQGVLVPVERSVAVTVEARDERGEELRLELEELAARVVQHELDHLDGVLILDRTTDQARREALGLLRPRIAFG
jgi:peptide deformylase